MAFPGDHGPYSRGWHRRFCGVSLTILFDWFAESPVLPGNKRSLGHFTMPLI